MKKSSAFKMKGPGQKSPVKANKKLIKQAGEIGKKGRNKLKEMIFDIPASKLLKKAKAVKAKFKGSTSGVLSPNNPIAIEAAKKQYLTRKKKKKQIN